MKNYDIVYANVEYVDNDIIVISWDVRDVGFGELVIKADTYEILDSECMSDEFCKQIIEYAMRKE